MLTLIFFFKFSYLNCLIFLSLKNLNWLSWRQILINPVRLSGIKWDNVLNTLYPPHTSINSVEMVIINFYISSIFSFTESDICTSLLNMICCFKWPSALNWPLDPYIFIRKYVSFFKLAELSLIIADFFVLNKETATLPQRFILL